jgi:hypothetical protein|tara:strand:- start:665 stop:1150 length:486 start_codon:yes stop_codon:yes gene_type:complete
MPGYAKKILMKMKKGGKVDKDKEKELDKKDPFRKVREEIEGKKHGGEMEYAKGGKVEITPEAKKIPKELEKASKMHKSQAERLKGMGFKHGGEMEYGHGGDVKKKKMGYADGGEAKPDFLDMDKDGDRKESMKKAVKDKKMKRMKHGGMVMKIVKKLKDKK